MNLTLLLFIRMVASVQVAPYQGVPSLSRKEIVKNITQCDPSQISLSIRVALVSVVPTKPSRGSLCPYKTKYRYFLDTADCRQSRFVPSSFGCVLGALLVRREFSIDLPAHAFQPRI